MRPLPLLAHAGGSAAAALTLVIAALPGAAACGGGERRGHAYASARPTPVHVRARGRSAAHLVFVICRVGSLVGLARHIPAGLRGGVVWRSV